MITTIAAGCLLIAAFITDVRKRKIPNALTASGWLAGMAIHAAMSGTAGVRYALIGTAVGFAPMLVLYLIRAVGAGDVKLFGAIGALTGGELVLQSMMYSLLYAALVGCVILLWRRQWKNTWSRIFMLLFGTFLWKDRKQWKPYVRSSHHLRFPFMWAVLPAAVTAYIQFI
ncbi:Type IV leader peptidase family protein [Paenibacillus konkukensis]|uniref:Type IV leader peptidase family protein n=1 Tax=Paenibacillus konkukensis TaxID=2020716 RepID=A0ABY4RJ21_9BACL|nr:prepilin peptidase [Paenibacillus konkukensis]UQZ81619.1 Type IV leader peptidase family protein [Paenibacillus konkukensis]